MSVDRIVAEASDKEIRRGEDGKIDHEEHDTFLEVREFVNAMIRAAHAKYQGQVPSLYEQWALFTENNLPPMSELEVAIDDEVRLPHRLSIVSRHFVLTT